MTNSENITNHFNWDIKIFTHIYLRHNAARTSLIKIDRWTQIGYIRMLMSFRNQNYFILADTPLNNSSFFQVPGAKHS